MVQVTEELLAPVTVAVNCCVPFGERLTEVGETVTETAAKVCSGAATQETATMTEKTNVKRANNFFKWFDRRQRKKE
jgi:hypothetical protein